MGGIAATTESHQRTTQPLGISQLQAFVPSATDRNVTEGFRQISPIWTNSEDEGVAGKQDQGTQKYQNWQQNNSRRCQAHCWQVRPRAQFEDTATAFDPNKGQNGNTLVPLVSCTVNSGSLAADAGQASTARAFFGAIDGSLSACRSRDFRDLAPHCVGTPSKTNHEQHGRHTAKWSFVG